MLESQFNIGRAFKAQGIEDPLDWLRDHLSCSLVDQNKDLLQTGSAPVDLLDYYKRWALKQGRFDEFARLTAVWDLRAKRFGWSGLFDPFTRGMADAVWTLLKERVEHHGYVPHDDRDEELLTCFGGISLAPPPEALEYDRINDRLCWKILEPASPTCEEMLEALSSHPEGYRLLFAIIAIDGQVCNGGFEQARDNGQRPCMKLAARTLELWNRPRLAAIVRLGANESDEYEELNTEYYRLRNEPVPDSFELDMWRFPTSHRELFRA